MKYVYLVVLFFAGFFLASCMTPGAQRLQTDPRFQRAAEQLVSGYLEGQKKGESGSAWGSGAARFFNLVEYRIVNCGWQWGDPTVFVTVKAGNQGGGNPIWEDYAIRLNHDPQKETAGDPYLGLSIGSVGPSLVKF